MRRHDLEIVRVIDEDGKMNRTPFIIVTERFDCREQIVEELKEKGFLEKLRPL